MSKKFSELNKSTRRILMWAWILFFVTLWLFLWILITHQIALDLIWIMFFAYGAAYAMLIWICTQIAYKLKNLKIGIYLFVFLLILSFGLLWFAVNK